MKIIITILALFFITACTTAPVKVPFPKAEPELMEPPKELKMITFEDPSKINALKLSHLMTTVVENYGICAENSIKYTAWQVWYAKHRELYEDMLGK